MVLTNLKHEDLSFKGHFFVFVFKEMFIIIINKGTILEEQICLKDLQVLIQSICFSENISSDFSMPWIKLLLQYLSDQEHCASGTAATANPYVAF